MPLGYRGECRFLALRCPEQTAARGAAGADPCTQCPCHSSAKSRGRYFALGLSGRSGILRFALAVARRAGIPIGKFFAALGNLTPNPFPCGKGNNRVCGRSVRGCALLTPAVGTSVEILRFAQDDKRNGGEFFGIIGLSCLRTPSPAARNAAISPGGRGDSAQATRKVANL